MEGGGRREGGGPEGGGPEGGGPDGGGPEGGGGELESSRLIARKRSESSPLSAGEGVVDGGGGGGGGLLPLGDVPLPV